MKCSDKNNVIKYDLEIDTVYKMESEDWIPLIDAMAYLSHLPQCGDVAKNLHDFFMAAKKGKYYGVTIGWHEEREVSIIGYADEMPLTSGREEWENIARDSNSYMKKIISEQWVKFNRWKKMPHIRSFISTIISIIKRRLP